MLKHLHFKMVVRFFFLFEFSITICREVSIQYSFRIVNKYSHYKNQFSLSF